MKHDFLQEKKERKFYFEVKFLIQKTSDFNKKRLQKFNF